VWSRPCAPATTWRVTGDAEDPEPPASLLPYQAGAVGALTKAARIRAAASSPPPTAGERTVQTATSPARVSSLFFDPELIAVRHADALRWLASAAGPDAPWRIEPLRGVQPS
jgi:hypothetical protein